MTDDAPLEEPRLSPEQEAFLAEYARVGTIGAGARAAGVAWRTAKRWTEQDPAFRARFEEARAQFKELLEEQLVQRIEEGDGAALRFKARGEMPEKYGPAARRPGSRDAGAEASRWEALERAAFGEEGE